MPFVALHSLAYDVTALAPIISAHALKIHHDDHLGGYVRKLNEICEKDPKITNYGRRSIRDLIMGSDPGSDVFDAAAQIWNHDFFFRCICPLHPLSPSKRLCDAIAFRFGSFERFLNVFADAAEGVFGSGWAWLVKNKDGLLDLTTTKDADLPMRHGQKALFTVDVWEHAYYLDYEYRRRLYLDRLLRNVANWSFVEKNILESQ